MEEKVRLQKVMARAGIASRRHSETMIVAGRVSVNNQVVRELGIRVDPQEDDIRVDGQIIGGAETFVYYKLHKPVAVITSTKDDRGRKTVLDFMPKIPQRVYPVGRLDYDSEGLVLLTNDGDAAHRLLRPATSVVKVYLVSVEGAVHPGALAQLKKGVELDDGFARFVYITRYPKKVGPWQVEVGLHEGRNRQIRRMFAAVGLVVTRLLRQQIGPLDLDNLRPGQCQALDQQEKQALFSALKGV